MEKLGRTRGIWPTYGAIPDFPNHPTMAEVQIPSLQKLGMHSVASRRADAKLPKRWRRFAGRMLPCFQTSLTGAGVPSTQEGARSEYAACARYTVQETPGDLRQLCLHAPYRRESHGSLWPDSHTVSAALPLTLVLGLWILQISRLDVWERKVSPSTSSA